MGGAIASPQTDATGRGGSAHGRWLLQYGECLSAGILMAVPSVLSSEPPTLDFPHVALVHSAL